MHRQAAPDSWTNKAKQQGLRARSAYKIKQIMERRPDIIRRGARVLELGSAPGGWSVVVAEKIGADGVLACVDLQDMQPVGGCKYFFHKGDFTTPPGLAFVEEHGPYDAIISDAAPSTTGNKREDAGASQDLVEVVCSFAPKLSPGGSLVAKIFQGADMQALLVDLRRQFEKVKPFKPEASRSDSKEIYIIAEGYKG